MTTHCSRSHSNSDIADGSQQQQYTNVLPISPLQPLPESVNISRDGLHGLNPESVLCTGVATRAAAPLSTCRPLVFTIKPSSVWPVFPFTLNVSKDLNTPTPTRLTSQSSGNSAKTFHCGWLDFCGRASLPHPQDSMRRARLIAETPVACGEHPVLCPPGCPTDVSTSLSERCSPDPDCRKALYGSIPGFVAGTIRTVRSSSVRGGKLFRHNAPTTSS